MNGEDRKRLELLEVSVVILWVIQLINFITRLAG